LLVFKPRYAWLKPNKKRPLLRSRINKKEYFLDRRLVGINLFVENLWSADLGGILPHAGRYVKYRAVCAEIKKAPAKGFRIWKGIGLKGIPEKNRRFAHVRGPIRSQTTEQRTLPPQALQTESCSKGVFLHAPSANCRSCQKKSPGEGCIHTKMDCSHRAYLKKIPVMLLSLGKDSFFSEYTRLFSGFEITTINKVPKWSLLAKIGYVNRYLVAL
jgi:hypothetical protein